MIPNAFLVPTGILSTGLNVAVDVDDDFDVDVGIKKEDT